MVAPIAILVIGLCIGAITSARRLPDLPPGMLGGVAFFAIVGLLSAALTVFGLHIYEFAEIASHESAVLGTVAATTQLTDMLWETSSLFALAIGLLLLTLRLAPASALADERAADDLDYE